MHPPARTLRVGIFPTLIVALVGLATMSHAQPMPQPQSPEKASGKTPPVVATTTLVTVTAPDGSESVYSSHRTIEIPAVPSASPAALCEGFWMGSNEVGFRLVSQTLIDTFKIAFLNMGVCSKVTVRAFPLVVSDNTITLNFDSPGVSSGSLTGTFCPGREQISGTFNYTSIHCGGTKSGRWVATPRVHCMAGPDIEISPRSLSFEVPEGGSASKSMTIKNAAGPGSCELFWYGKYLDLDLLNKSGEVSPDLLRAARPQVVIDKPGVKAAVHGLAINDDGMVPAEIHPRLSSDRPSPPPATVDDLGDVVHSFDYAIPGLFGLEWIDGFLWASGSSDRVLNKLDPLHGAVLDQVGVLEATRTSGLAWDGDAFWATDPTDEVIYQIDHGGNILTTLKAPSTGSVGLAWDGAYLWDVDWVSRTLHKIDPANGEVLLSYDVPDSRPAGTAWDGKYLWINGRSNATAYRIDPSDGSVVESFPTPPGAGANNGQGAAFDGEYLWIANADEQRIYQIDIGWGGDPALCTSKPLSGTLAAGESDAIDVTVDASELSPGTHLGMLAIYSEDRDNNPAMVPVKVEVGAVSVEEISSLPDAYALSQNFPNPFNPSTTVSYDIPTVSVVKLAVFNSIGEKIATLASGLHEPGRYTKVWDAAGHPSGVYFCRLQAGSFIRTTKMQLLK